MTTLEPSNVTVPAVELLLDSVTLLPPIEVDNMSSFKVAVSVLVIATPVASLAGVTLLTVGVDEPSQAAPRIDITVTNRILNFI